MKNKIIVTGGAGFIGSHTIVELIASGYDPVIVDNFSNSEKSSIIGLEKIVNRKIKVYNIHCQDERALNHIFTVEKNIVGVIHFAAYKSVSESEIDPLKYYENNLGSLISVMKMMHKHDVGNLVFSSSATVYGNVDLLPVKENAPLNKAESAYGQSKQICEEMITTVVSSQSNLNVAMLRYFNPVGAHPSGLIGELPIGKPENLMPYITQTAIGKREELVVFGNDYNTPDGTCIRDYIHVVDLAKAHLKSLDWLKSIKETKQICETFNIGTGKGNSVLELINAFEKVNSVKLNYKIGIKRKGDLEQIYADCTKAKQYLNWESELSAIDALRDAWNWELQLSKKKLVKA